MKNSDTTDRAEVPDLSVSGDKFDLAEDDPHDPTTTSEPEAPMQSLNQLHHLAGHLRRRWSHHCCLASRPCKLLLAASTTLESASMIKLVVSYVHFLKIN